jgi:DNA-binding IscR family transcriptional regulator
MSVLAKHAGRGPVCSNLVALSVNTNPVVIRRLMSDLEKAELVTSASGRTGGFSLARSAE